MEKIKFCLGVEVTYSDVKINVREEIQNLLDALYDKCEDHNKSEALAMKTKNQGSKAYLKKKDKEALNCFSESICLAPAESSVLPLALANRSAVLYQMHRYKEALQDMEWAERACYPAALRHKLLVRRCRCYLAMNDVKKAREVLEVCKNHVRLVPVEAKEKYETEVADLKQKIDSHIPTSSTITSQENLQQPTLYGGENEIVKYITNAFEMR